MDPLQSRLVLPELLDTLPSADPAAIQSRRELRLINGIMGNHRWLMGNLAAVSVGGASPRILELGAGDGGALEAALRAGTVHASQWTAVDLAPAPEGWPAESTWLQGDLFGLKCLPEAEVLVANLFLHHFEIPALARIGQQIPASCRLFLACEPARYRLHGVQGRVLSWLAAFGPVTRHDMDLSIRAGFRGNELPDWLGLQGWQVRVTRTVLGAYRMRAWR